MFYCNWYLFDFGVFDFCACVYYSHRIFEVLNKVPIP
jgi:hypothetical protein